MYRRTNPFRLQVDVTISAPENVPVGHKRPLPLMNPLTQIKNTQKATLSEAREEGSVQPEAPSQL